MQNMMVFLAQKVPEGRVFGLDTQTLISIGIQLLNGVILAVALTYILYKPVKEFMGKRTEKIKKKIEDSEAAMAKANELIAEYDLKLKQIEEERIEIMETARQEATEENQRIIDEARKEAHEIKKKSLESVSEDRKRMQEEARLYIIELSTLMAQKYIANNIDDDTQERLFEEMIARLEDAQWKN